MSNFVSLSSQLKTAVEKHPCPFVMPARHDLCEFLKQFRESKGLSRLQITERSDVHRQVVYDTETGGRFPSTSVALGYAHAMKLKGVERDAFLLALDVVPEDTEELLKANPGLCQVLRDCLKELQTSQS